MANYKNLTEIEKNQIAKQYEALVHKLTNQFFKRGLCTWQVLSSMAWEGFAIALNNYDEERSKMNFTQYAAFAIRNNILTCLDNELRTVKLSAYAQKKVTERGETTFNTISMDIQEGWNNNDEDSPNYKSNKVVSQLAEPCKFADGDVYEYMYSRLENNFPERDCKIFYMSFGLRGYEDMKGYEIAKELGVSSGFVSNHLKSVIEWIRKDNEICEMLNNLVG